MTKPIEFGQMRQLLSTIAVCRQNRETRVLEPRTIDQSQLDDIRNCVGPARLARLLELVQAELHRRPAMIRACAERRDFLQLRHEAHSFHGAVASFGLVGVALATEAVELASTHGAELALALDRLEDEAMGASVALAPLICGHQVAAAVDG